MRKEKVPGSPVICSVQILQLPLPTERPFPAPSTSGCRARAEPLGKSVPVSLCQAEMSYSNSEARVQSSPDSEEIQASKPCGFLAASFRQRGGSASASC